MLDSATVFQEHLKLPVFLISEWRAARRRFFPESPTASASPLKKVTVSNESRNQ
jgi:hypothetical protein